jgi:1A family penicillin-binding protein
MNQNGMPIPHLRKRVYGYLDQSGKEKPDTAQIPQEKPFGTAQGKRKTPRNGVFIRIVSGIFRGIFLIFRLIGRGIGWVWSKGKKGILLTGLTTMVLGFLGLTVVVAWVSRDLPDPDRLTDRHIAQSTKIYDRTGKVLLYEIFASEKRTIVELEDIPQHLVDGVIATEDTKFFEHHGIRPLSIARSFVYGLIGRGRVGGGASTLTQQLVKNAILTNERTITRKIKEIILSIRLEQKYNKKQILKIYFNEIPYGSTNYGVEAASQSYFGKHVSDLTLAESATLAGLPRAPSYYLNNPIALKTRRNFVLSRMAEEGYISAEEADAAKGEPLNLEQRYTDIKAPHFVLYVKELLTEQFGENLVDTGGLKVVTTLDWPKQQIAEDAVSSTASVFKEANANNASLVAMDPKTGQILAMVGSRNFFDDTIDGQFNVATLGLRQPGSSFKPIVYAAAFEKGYTPETLLFDVETDFAAAGKEYKPHNYDGREHGLVTVRTALQGSLNIPAVKMLYLTGPDTVIKRAEQMGYTTLSTGDFGLSLVLGGGEVKLLEHTAAYGVFANNGVHRETTPLLRVEDAKGETLYAWKKSEGERVFEEKTMATLSNVLSDDAARAYVFGAGSILTLPDRPVAAKTGTTNNYVDAWTLGYTPSLVAGVWAGNTNNTPLKAGFGGGKVAGTIWNVFMKKALAGTPVETFPTPEPNDATKPVLRGSSSGNITIPVDIVTGNIATSSTPPEFIEERTYIPPHSILHYVNKDDPRGPVPEHPEEDPQYIAWETGVRDWVRRMREENPGWTMRFDDPPTNVDTPESFALLPTLDILSPSPNAVFTERRITADVRASAVRGIRKISYKIDGKFIQRSAAI